MPILVLVYLGIRAFGPIFGQWQKESIFFFGCLPFKGTLHSENVIFAGGGVLNPAKVSKIFTSTSCKRTMKINFFVHQYQNVHDRNEDESNNTAHISRQRCQRRECKIFQLRGMFSY